MRDRAELLMLNTPGWDKWFLDTLWTLLPGSLYGPTDEWGDWIYEDPDRFERVLKISDRVKSQRQAADDLIYYLGSIRDPKVIRILGPILLLEGETYKDFDVSWQSSNAKADIALSDMNVYGFPAFKPSDIQHKWWLKNKDLTDEQWWELLRKGHEEIVKLHTPFTSEGRPNPPPPPPPAPVTPPPTLVPKPITPVPAPRIIRGSSLSTPRRQPHVPQLASEAGAFWPRWFAVGSVTTSLGWLLLRKGDNSSQG